MKSKLFLLQLLSFSSFAATDYCKDGTGLYVNVCFNDDLSAAVDDLQAEIDSQVSAESQSRADGDASTLSSANTYTNEVFSSFTADSNKKFESIDHKINKLSDRLNAAIAGSTAIASIPYVAEDSFSFGVGIGNYSNGNAVALGSQYKTSRNSNIRVNVSWDSTGNVASGAGFSAGW